MYRPVYMQVDEISIRDGRVCPIFSSGENTSLRGNTTSMHEDSQDPESQNIDSEVTTRSIGRAHLYQSVAARYKSICQS